MMQKKRTTIMVETPKQWVLYECPVCERRWWLLQTQEEHERYGLHHRCSHWGTPYSSAQRSRVYGVVTKPAPENDKGEGGGE